MSTSWVQRMEGKIQVIAGRQERTDTELKRLLKRQTAWLDRLQQNAAASELRFAGIEQSLACVAVKLCRLTTRLEVLSEYMDRRTGKQ